MLATLIAVLCHGQLCQEHIMGRMQQMECQVRGQAVIAQWIRDNEPAATLERYKCVPGEYKPATGL